MIVIYEVFVLLVQQPGNLPSPEDNTPLDLTSWSEVILYILLPILFMIFYFWWRKKRDRD
ncbi:adenylosuccinate synthetase [Robertkochia solimangrovi]|nr:adenylosuccinate synthetase [Robertkochia solimangrovi]